MACLIGKPYLLYCARVRVTCVCAQYLFYDVERDPECLRGEGVALLFTKLTYSTNAALTAANFFVSSPRANTMLKHRPQGVAPLASLYTFDARK